MFLKYQCRQSGVVFSCTGSINCCVDRVDVIICLSEVVRNDTVTDNKHRISHKCRKQLTAEALQWEDAAQLDPRLKKMCSKSMKEFCDDVDTGPAEVRVCTVLLQCCSVGVHYTHLCPL